ncbi:unnamed protein product, partial [Scytosiphon promiscuus]
MIFYRLELNKLQIFYIKIIVFVILGLNFLPCSAQHNIIKFSKLKVDDGLSESWITEICRDEDGFIWIGTFNGGLNRYDGYTTKIYNNNKSDENSIASNRIGAILSDSKGRLWVGNRYEGGLNLYNKEKD